MKYTNQDKQDIARALKLIRPYIKKGHHKRICAALGLSAPYGWNLARHYVMRQLAGHHTLESWIAGQYASMNTPAFAKLIQHCHEHQEKMRKTRVAWIDHMIQTLEA